MRKTLRTIGIFILLILLSLNIVFAKTSLPSLEEKDIYYTEAEDYIKGDCVLSSCKMMLRRAAILNGSAKWNTITNNAMRSVATNMDTNAFKGNFSYSNDGVIYTISNATLTGETEKEKLNNLKTILKEHPEGVIVWGKYSTKYEGMHGVLATSIKDDILYAADPSRNRQTTATCDWHKGIMKWDDTTMRSIKYCTKYWYLKNVSGTVKTPADENADGTPVVIVERPASTLSIKDAVCPTEIIKGKGFNIKGTVNSNYVIESVTVKIINSSKKTVISKTAKPNAKTYSLSKIDSSIKFGSLSTGNYIYSISAKDSEKEEKIFEKTFKVVPASTLKISSYTYPKTLKKGKGFVIKGNISSNYKIESVQVDVTTTSGTQKQSASAKPNKKTYSVKSLDSKIKFGKLPKGTYYYKIIVKDEQKTVTLVKKKFTVK